MTRPAIAINKRDGCDVEKGAIDEYQPHPNFVDLGHHPVAIRR